MFDFTLWNAVQTEKTQTREQICNLRHDTKVDSIGRTGIFMFHFKFRIISRMLHQTYESLEQVPQIKCICTAKVGIERKTDLFALNKFSGRCVF